ncbi:MAG: hypothetical protein V1902_01390 [Candidatus Falkowbacteria bacterium]
MLFPLRGTFPNFGAFKDGGSVMGERRLFGLDPEEMLGLEEAVFRVLVAVKSTFIGTTKRFQVYVHSEADATQTAVAYEARRRRNPERPDEPRIADKHGRSLCIYVYREEFSKEERGCTEEAKALSYKWPFINGMSDSAVSTLVAKRVKQLLLMSHTLTLKVDEFGNDYWYVYRQETKDVEKLR